MDKHAIIDSYYMYDFFGFIVKTPKDIGGKSFSDNKPLVTTYTEMVLLCAMDNVSNPKVKDFILGGALAMHADESVLQMITNYQPLPQDSAIERLATLSAELTTIYQKLDYRNVINAKREIVFKSLQAARADGELSDSEIQRIEAMGDVLNVSKNEIATIIDIIKDNHKIRKRRAQLVFAEVADKLR